MKNNFKNRKKSKPIAAAARVKMISTSANSPKLTVI